MRIAVGTSGFAYREWKGSFYPAKIKAAAMLPYYAAHLHTVEINSTFYRLPAPGVMAGWAEQVPAGFSFAVKANRRITHMSRLKNVAAPLEALLKVCAELGPRLGPLLFGLPPNFKKDLPRLRDFLASIPSGPRRPRVAFEFRHDSWFHDEVYAALHERNVALCVAEADRDEGLVTPLVATARWGYLRLRKRRYGPKALASWAARVRAQRWSDVVIYFKHEDGGTGPVYARRLLAALE